MSQQDGYGGYYIYGAGGQQIWVDDPNTNPKPASPAAAPSSTPATNPAANQTFWSGGGEQMNYTGANGTTQSQTGAGNPNVPANPIDVAPKPAYQAPVTSPGTQNYANPITGQQQQLTPDQELVQANTNRQMDYLRSTLGQGQTQGVNMLRQNLAQRGILDSGSLGQGISNITNNTQNQLAQGVQAAATNQNDTLMGLIQQARAYQQQKEMQAAQLSYEQWAMQQQMEQQRMMANSQMWGGALQGGLSGLGAIGGALLVA